MAIAVGMSGGTVDEDDTLPDDFLFNFRDHDARTREKLNRSLKLLDSQRGL